MATPLESARKPCPYLAKLGRAVLLDGEGCHSLCECPEIGQPQLLDPIGVKLIYVHGEGSLRLRFDRIEQSEGCSLLRSGAEIRVADWRHRRRNHPLPLYERPRSQHPSDAGATSDSEFKSEGSSPTAILGARCLGQRSVLSRVLGYAESRVSVAVVPVCSSSSATRIAASLERPAPSRPRRLRADSPRGLFHSLLYRVGIEWCVTRGWLLVRRRIPQHDPQTWRVRHPHIIRRSPDGLPTGDLAEVVRILFGCQPIPLTADTWLGTL